MKVLLNDKRPCQGYGNCVPAEPRVFDLDDEGYVTLLTEDVPDDLVEGVRYAIQQCPARAITLDE